jgi:hypothetical protein
MTFSDYNSAASATRTRLGVDRLTPAMAQEVRAAVARHEERAARSRSETNTAMERLRRRLRVEVRAAVEPLLDRLYKVAQSSWAGGMTTDEVTIGRTPSASGTTSRAWSSNGKWSGSNLTRRVTVMPAWRKHVQGREIGVLDGLLTTHAELALQDNDTEVYRAAWVRQGRGYELHSETGWIAYHRPSGTAYHSPGDWSQNGTTRAVRGLRRKLKAQAIPASIREAARTERIRKRDERRAGRLARLTEQLLRRDFTEFEEVRVTRQDSLRAGNCVPGTDQFIDKFFPNRSKVSIAEIVTALQRHAPNELSSDHLDLARQVAASCLVAIRRARRIRRESDNSQDLATVSPLAN